MTTVNPPSNRFAMPGRSQKASFSRLAMQHEDEDVDTTSASTAFSDIPLSTNHVNNHNIDNQIGYSVGPVASPRISYSDGITNNGTTKEQTGLMPFSNFTIDDDDDEQDGIIKTDTFGNENDENDDDVEQQKQQPLQVYSAEASIETSLTTTTTNNHPPPNYRCPLTLQLMEDPVNDSCGHCFERRAIMDWLEYRDVCPISRKPLDYRQDLFTNGSLKMRILEWKEEHPLYQNCDMHYAEHQAAEVLGYRDNDDDLDEEQLRARKKKDPHSQFELMLLPQERQVLNIVKARAVDRRKRQDKNNCIKGTIITVILGIVVLILLVFLGRKLQVASNTELPEDGNVNATRF